MPYGVTRKVWKTLSPASKQLSRTEYYKAKTAEEEAKIASQRAASERKAVTAKAKSIRRQNSWNPVTRAMERSKARHQAKLAEIQAKGKNAALDPVAKRTKIESDAEVAKITAKGKADAFKYAAIATGMTQLGQGLSDENNQDNYAKHQADQKSLETIFGNSVNKIKDAADNSNENNSESSYGLEQGYY